LVTLSAILAPLLLPSPTRTLQTTAGEIATTLREARRQAQAGQARKRFLIDTDSGQYGIEGAGSWRTLPAEVTAALTTGESLLTGDTRGGIDFFPDGTSTGGRVELGFSERSLKIDIEWLTGRVRVQENAL
jgi:general secretion pathway protein H